MYRKRLKVPELTERRITPDSHQDGRALLSNDGMTHVETTEFRIQSAGRDSAPTKNMDRRDGGAKFGHQTEEDKK
jgi:hypothetical protein